MSFDLTLGFDNPDPEECPVTFQDVITLLNALIRGSLDGDFIPYVTGAATPAVDDQDKVWHRLDAQGRPIGAYVYYSGSWRKQYTASIGQISYYNGDPDVDFGETGGRGTVGGEWDGWQLCNGENGSPNLSDKFIVGAKMDDLSTGYPNGDGPWTTGVSGESTQEGAGVHEITLNADNTFRLQTDAVTLGYWQADGNTPNAAAGLIGRAGGGSDFDLIDADAGKEEPDAIPTLPPYYALALVVFIGYE